MANIHRGEISINLGGRSRKMRISLNSLAELQQEFGRPLLDIFAELDKFNVLVIRSLLYYSLREDDKDLTREMLGSWDIDLPLALAKLGEAISACLGEPKGAVVAGKKKKGEI